MARLINLGAGSNNFASWEQHIKKLFESVLLDGYKAIENHRTVFATAL